MKKNSINRMSAQEIELWESKMKLPFLWTKELLDEMVMMRYVEKWIETYAYPKATEQAEIIDECLFCCYENILLDMKHLVRVMSNTGRVVVKSNDQTLQLLEMQAAAFRFFQQKQEFPYYVITTGKNHEKRTIGFYGIESATAHAKWMNERRGDFGYKYEVTANDIYLDWYCNEYMIEKSKLPQ